jgi:DNA (cytosine-5)-methyltransferase 1
MSVPWRAGAPNPWVVLAAEILAGSDRSVARSVWSIAQKNFTTPRTTLKNEDRVFQIGSLVGKPARAEKLIAVADALSDASKEELSEWENFAAVPGISNNLAKLAETLGTPVAGHVLALQPALRVAARFSGRPVDLVNKNSDGRLEIARLVGGSIFQSDAELNRSRDAFAALLELGETLCGPKKTECAACPLAFGCVSRSSSEQLSL